MSKAEQIRAMGDMKPSEIAAAIGTSAGYVSTVRWKTNNPDTDRRSRTAARKRWVARNPEVAREQHRRSYHRNKKLGGIGHPTWSREHTTLLAMLHAVGRSFGEIADEMGVSRSTVAGRLHRLRKAGVIT